MNRILLGIISLVLLSAFMTPARAQSRASQPREPILPKEGWPTAVTARGETEERAKEVAVAESVRVVTALMRMQERPLKSFTVTEDYVRANVLAGNGHAGKEILLEGFPNPFKEWTIPFRKDHNAWWRDLVKKNADAEFRIQEQERSVNAEYRQTLAGRGLFGLAGLLLAGFGYVRLNEYTHRRYSRWLRMAGIGVASLVLATWWLVIQAG